MTILKSVEVFPDVKCENCDSYNQGQCCKDLPAIPVEKNNRCGEGSWLFDGRAINYRQICLELVPRVLVTDVDDLECKVCIYYRPSKEECHFHRKDIYKSVPNDWCDNGMWLYQESDDKVILVTSSFLHPND